MSLNFFFFSEKKIPSGHHCYRRMTFLSGFPNCLLWTSRRTCYVISFPARVWLIPALLPYYDTSPKEFFLG